MGIAKPDQQVVVPRKVGIAAHEFHDSVDGAADTIDLRSHAARVVDHEPQASPDIQEGGQGLILAGQIVEDPLNESSGSLPRRIRGHLVEGMPGDAFLGRPFGTEILVDTNALLGIVAVEAFVFG